MRLPLILLTCLLCVACTTTDSNKVASAATTPLSDLNLVNAPIPDALVAAQQAPYALPASMDCTLLATELGKLDEVLGADLDAPVTEAHRGLVERGVESASSATVDALQRTAQAVVPFRGWVRKLTGAERYSNRVAAAIAAGTVRRGFLKGLRAAQKCS
jgi:hypothetical protein